MDYHVATAHFKNGGRFAQVLIAGGAITHVRGYGDIPFSEADVDRFEITHDKWDW